jgi:hypothetical protein
MKQTTIARVTVLPVFISWLIVLCKLLRLVLTVLCFWGGGGGGAPME